MKKGKIGVYLSVLDKAMRVEAEVKPSGILVERRGDKVRFTVSDGVVGMEIEMDMGTVSRALKFL